MKDFFKYVFATIVGLILFGIIMAILGVMSIVGMISSGQATQNVSDNSVLVLKLSGSMDEQAGDNTLAQFTGNAISSMGLNETLSAIKKAKDNDKVKGIYIEAGALSSDYASMQEVRSALADFKKSGKWIVAYADTYTQGAYYISSVADKVYLNPQGELDWHGLGSQPLFVKDLLAKMGVKMQIIKVGKYKSATEMYSEDHMSDANREQTQAYINGLWQNICKEVAASRKLTVEKLNEYADSGITFSEQKDLIAKKMIDGLLYTDQVKKEVKKLLKLDEDKSIRQLSIADMANVKQKDKGEKIAVYYAFGNIVDNPATGYLMGSDNQIVAKDVCKDIEGLMNDDKVKAVVVRVNSPGGSAYASEQIWHQIEMLKAKKPVVVSMGGYAASGGYYISSGANWIVAEPTTLTGSIGIFGQIPDPSQLLTQKLGVKFDEVKTNKFSLMGSMARPMNDDEISLLTKYIARGYDTFRKRVADGRKMTVEQVEEIAQGHVFTGEDALKIKLVDEMGGLEKAIEKAAKLAKLDEYYTADYPAPKDLFQQLMSNATTGSYLDEQIRLTLGDYYEPFLMLKTMNQQSVIQARLPFFLNIH